MPVSMGKEETDDDKRAGPRSLCVYIAHLYDVVYTAQHLKIDLGFQSFRLKLHDGTKQLRLEPEEWNEFKKFYIKKGTL